MTASTLARVAAPTRPEEFTTLETVFHETPAAAATSFRLGALDEGGRPRSRPAPSACGTAGTGIPPGTPSTPTARFSPSPAVLRSCAIPPP
ncbi:hypothetical protein GCM10025875_18710 [Litorihabitans aurantiacus]|uniref:Uncharacterized protein n=1 Tax=Litorihabitans aurantiacus TaxID=1930061 RepID=A0AA37XEW0_9MICO|nr:hypothetical protein [Litorihabitans aurantiacus]GMA31879.1 hypothetical protein GCM10025875_18710 [Litorihabitans aurantiacus]